MSIGHDFRYALRALQKNSGFTMLAAITLALGIGANTAIFIVIRAAFLSPLPFPEEERLAILWQSNPAQGIARELVSPANFVDWDAQNTVFEQLGAWPTVADTVVAFNLRVQNTSGASAWDVCLLRFFPCARCASSSGQDIRAE